MRPMNGYEMLARLYEDHAFDAALEADAAASPAAAEYWRETEADADGLASGYRFRAEEIRYVARGSMTEAQACDRGAR